MPESIVTEMVSYKTNGDQATAYLARPAGPGRHQALVVIQEWWGVDAHIKDVTERFARLGFAALAPDLYHGRVTAEPDEARKLMLSMEMPRAAKEIDAAGSWLARQPFSRGPKFGTIGYCLGGGLSLSTAARNPNVGACVVYYGALPNPPESSHGIQSPVLAFYGSDEKERAEQLQQLLQRYDKTLELHIYEGARHGFFNDTGKNYHRAFGYDTWARAIEFFHKHLS